MRVSRISHITIETPDLSRQVDYYQRVMGLSLIEQDRTSAYLATQVGELAVALVQGPLRRCAKLTFQIAPEFDLRAAAHELSRVGVKADLCHDVHPGSPAVLALSDINGIEIELVVAQPFFQVKSIGGVAPFRFGHAAFVVADPQATSEFYENVLGFRVSDWVADFFVFMRCGPEHHTVNFLRAQGCRMHHFAFELRDAAHLMQSCEVLGRDNLEIIWGPVRHGPGHNIATYHVNPDNLIVELYTEMDRMSDESLGYFDPKPWHRDRPQRPKVWPAQQRRDIWGAKIPDNFLLQGA